MTEIDVDFRESDLIHELQKRGITFNTKNLEIGDIQVRSTSGNLLVFERKTVSDLAASIKDGRYREQKQRMLASVPAKNITYVIEGGNSMMRSSHGLSEDTFQGAFINCMYRDGVHVVFTKDSSETASWIVGVSHRCDKYDVVGSQEYHHQCKVKTKKIDNITPDTCFLLQLCQIPGVSQKIAEIIRDKYGNMRTLITSLSGSATPLSDLTSLPMIGDKKATKICEYLIGS